MGFSVEVRDRGVLDALRQTLAVLGPAGTRERLDEIGQWAVSEIHREFRATQDPRGNTWKPSKRAREQGGKTLTDHGHLRDSNTYYVAGTTLHVGNASVYAAIHNEGFDGQEVVQAHQRMIHMVFGRKVAPHLVNVRQFTRHMRMQKRQFIPTDSLPKRWADEFVHVLVQGLPQ